jgi:hypothetical protein
LYANKTPPQLNVSCSVSDSSIDVGEDVTFTGSATGGSGSGYLYSWDGAVTGSGSTKTRSFSTPGNYSASVSVVDGANNTHSTYCQTIIVSRPLGTGDPSRPVGENPPIVEIYYNQSGTPPVVPIGQKCTIGFISPFTSVSGSCNIFNVLGDKVNDSPFSYTHNSTELFTIQVNPQNSYRVDCQDDYLAVPGFAPTVSTSAVLGCVLNPNIVEQ